MKLRSRMLLVLVFAGVDLFAAPRLGAEPSKSPGVTEAAAIDFAKFDAEQLAFFERKAAIAKRLGATHVPIIDGLPTAQRAANIPPVMPEAFFTANPELRGPRVDLPNRRSPSALLDKAPPTPPPCRPFASTTICASYATFG